MRRPFPVAAVDLGTETRESALSVAIELHVIERWARVSGLLTPGSSLSPCPHHTAAAAAAAAAAEHHSLLSAWNAQVLVCGLSVATN